MQSLRRFVVGFVVLGFLWSGAALTFQIARSRPRCVITGPYWVAQVSADGSRLVSRGYRRSGRPNAVQVWDTYRGELLHKIDDEEDISDPMFSPDGRYAVLTVGRVPVLVECQTGAEWRFDEFARSGLYFSPKGRWLLTPNAEALGCIDVARHEAVPFPNESLIGFNANEQPVFKTRAGAPELFVWDLHRREKIAVAPWTADPDMPVTSSNGALAAEITREPTCPDCDTFNYQIDVWDLTTLERCFQRKLSAPAHIGFEVKFSPDARTAAILVKEQQTDGQLQTHAQFLDTRTGDLLATSECDDGEFSPDGSLWCSLVPIDNDRNAFKVFDVATGRVLWETPEGRVWRFLGTTGSVLYQYDPEEPLQLLDARTGQVRATIRFDRGTVAVPPEPTADGRHFQVLGSLHAEQPSWKAWLEEQWPDIFGFQCAEEPFVAVYETATGRRLLWLRNHGGAREMFSDDGSTLATADRANDDEGGWVIRVWDVSPAKAYRWAVVAAAALGIALLGLRWTWCKWQRRIPRATSKPIAQSQPE